MGWIYVPGTQIDYPILQEQKFGESFYLTHNIYRVAQKAGSIFTPAEPEGAAEDVHMLLSGHHMKSGKMFGDLTKYKKEDFYKKHPYVYIYTPDKTSRWGIWTAEHVKDGHSVYLMPYSASSPEYEELRTTLEKNSLYKTPYFGFDLSKRSITMSTCDNIDRTGTGRFIVSAVLDKEIEPVSSDAVDDVSEGVTMDTDDTYSDYSVNESDSVIDDGNVIRME